MMIAANRIEGVVFGTAIGDALGYTVEFNKAKLPIHDIAECIDARAKVALYSDDTQMFLATVGGIFDACEGLKEPLYIERAAEHIAKRYVAWSKSPENNRAPGGACMYGCANLGRGVHWEVAGKPEGKGCGAAMRSMAYSLFMEIEQSARWAAQHALMTHRDPSAQASAAAVAAGVRACLEGLSKNMVSAIMVSAAMSYDRWTGAMLNKAIEDARAKTPAVTVLNRWRGWRGDEAVAASLFCFLQGSGIDSSVLAAVNSPGDSDSLGAITGALAGAFYGVEKIPESWKAHIENADELRAVARRISGFQMIDV